MAGRSPGARFAASPQPRAALRGVAANLPDRARYSVTRCEVDYARRAVGDLVAHASLEAAQQRALREEPKGRLVVPVQVLDREGNEPARLVIEWAWKHP